MNTILPTGRLPSSIWRWALAALAVAAISLALVALESEPASAGSATASRAKKVDIADFAYHPKTLRVNRGAKVAFVNSSDVTHTATRAGSFDTGEIAPGSSVVVRFTHRGTFAYHCTIHPFMHGKIVVK
jgi:plastocyanin